MQRTLLFCLHAWRAMFILDMEDAMLLLMMLACDYGDLGRMTAGPAATISAEQPCSCPLLRAHAPPEDFVITLRDGTPEELTDTQSVSLENLCDKDLEILLLPEDGRYGAFWPDKQEGDKDGAGSGELTFTLLAGQTVERDVTYTLRHPEELPGDVTNDWGNFSANVMEDNGATIVFEGKAHLKAVIRYERAVE